jgi:hypothetical protein
MSDAVDRVKPMTSANVTQSSACGNFYQCISQANKPWHFCLLAHFKAFAPVDANPSKTARPPNLALLQKRRLDRPKTFSDLHRP